ncbi:MAG: argininosuccinate lyase [Bacteroidota bacterium]
MKLWDKGAALNEQIEKFTIGMDKEIDLLLAPYDVLGSLAHIQMLESIDLLTAEELEALQKELKSIYRDVIEKGEFIIEPGIEDVHSQIELMLTRKLGDVGKKIHSGRSRNDQVMVDLKLYIRNELKEITDLCVKLFETLQSLSNTHKDVLLPGYTHTQIAMPSSFGLWFGAYAESLVDDMHLMEAAFKITNQNPLGSAAGYGSSFPLNRQMTTDLLGFESMNYNVVYAQMGRGKTEKSVSFALASIASTLSKFAADICLYNSQNFGFVTFPDQFTTGSSIMPHKKNPDVFELIRAKTNKIQALPYEISLITGNLISGYHRDLQVIKENFFPAFSNLRDCLEICEYAISQVQVNTDILKDPKYEHLFSVEVVNEKVLSGIPFREAYQLIGKEIAEGTYQPSGEVNHTHEGSIGNLMNENVAQKMQKVSKNITGHSFGPALQKLLD